MKKYFFALLLLASPLSFAQEAKGVIKEIQICGTGTKGPNWSRTLQFKVDGKWFGTWADHVGGAIDYDDTISTSLVFMAASQKLPVHIKATEPWVNLFKNCGVNEGAVFYRNNGDFIRISY